MTAHGIKMESIIMRGKLSQDANKGIMDENDRLLNIFSKETSTRLLYVENPISLFGALRTRNGAPVIVLEGHLEINPTLSIKGAKIGATLWQKLFPEYEAKLQCGSAYVIQNIKVVKNHSEYKHDKERNDEVWLCKENEPVLRVGGDFFHLRSTPFCLLSPAKKRNLYSGPFCLLSPALTTRALCSRLSTLETEAQNKKIHIVMGTFLGRNIKFSYVDTSAKYGHFGYFQSLLGPCLYKYK
ncbi:hypothetical protein GLYMA_06G244302v4 [Glycine max]|nr:hypothetical protein GYH30_016146 [Glycine max]KRH55277.2 hypothetical protein GLYMA_06G244302v4 [Glycine max]